MLTGAGLAARRHHDLTYRFFAVAPWCPDQHPYEPFPDVLVTDLNPAA